MQFPFNLVFSEQSSSSRLDRFSLQSTTAYKAVEAALDLDSKNGNVDIILQLYTTSLKELQSAKEVGEGIQEVADKMSKLEKTISSVEDRLLVLHGMKDKEMSMYKSIQPKDQKAPSSTKLNAKKAVRSKESTAMAHQILDEVLVDKPNVPWDAVIGLDAAKKSLHEVVVLPYLRPELFTGLRAPARGVLLFGPPGTGKTMLAKAVATESKARFFAISASTITSKNYGDGEKLVRALFDMARELQPSIVFIDEIDSILTARSDNEHEASRRLKTEFLLQFDGISSGQDDRILLLAATNRPQDLDQAALRRLVKRIYIPLPEQKTRKALLTHLLSTTTHNLSIYQLDQLAGQLEGYSSSDITALAKESSLGPIRGLGSKLLTTAEGSIRPISYQDFQNAMKMIRPSVSPSYMGEIEQWNLEKGSL